MGELRNISRIFILALLIAFLATSCASTCKQGGWYAKDRHLGPKNKAIKYKR